MDHKKALDKIKKLLRLANSSNPHEAAAAMRQARALMEKHQLDQTDVDIADIEEHGTRSGSKMKPALWESRLAQPWPRLTPVGCSSRLASVTGDSLAKWPR